MGSIGWWALQVVLFGWVVVVVCSGEGGGEEERDWQCHQVWCDLVVVRQWEKV